MDKFIAIHKIRSRAIGMCHPTRRDMRRIGRELKRAADGTSENASARLEAEHRIAEIHGQDLAISLGE